MLDVSTLVLIMFSRVPVCVQEMLGRWRTWAELWCYTDGPSCPTRPTPANAKAPATRRRCSSTPAWLARTVWKGSCCTAPKHTASHYRTFLICVNKHFPAMSCLFLFMYVCVSPHCPWKCFLLLLPVVSPCLALHRLEQCISHSPSTCMFVFTHWPHSSLMSRSHLFYQINFIHQWILQRPFSV